MNSKRNNIIIIVALAVFAHVALAYFEANLRDFNEDLFGPNLGASCAALFVAVSAAMWYQNLRITYRLCKTGNSELVKKCLVEQFFIWLFVWIAPSAVSYILAYGQPHNLDGIDKLPRIRDFLQTVIFCGDVALCEIACVRLKKLFV